jgi:hypothetical protein
MTNRSSMLAMLLACSALVPIGAGAQQDATPAASANPIEPDAIAALDRMGKYLRSLKAFSLKSDTTIDEVTDDGMKLQFGGTVSMTVKRPNGLRAELNSDRKQRQFYYDGKTVTLYGPRNGYYAVAPAPATLGEMVDNIDQKFGVRLPMTDLFTWGDEASKAAVKEAALIGPARIGGALCDHVAVRQEGVDWQVWIERGKTPVPRKLVITTTSEPAQPQFVALMQWNAAPKLDANTFRFTPPKNAHRIPITGAEGAAAK